MNMSRYLNLKLFLVLFVATLLVACKSIPEWDIAMIDSPVEDGKCPDLSGRFNYEHLGANDTRGMDSILRDYLLAELPADRVPDPADYKPMFLSRGAERILIPRPTPDDFYPGHYASGDIYLKIYKGRYFEAYRGTVIVTLNRLDRDGRKYHVRVDWDKEGLLGEYDFKFNDMWVCSGGNLFRSVKNTLHEWPDPDELNPRDYRRIYVLPNGNIRIDRKHTFIYRKNQNELFRYYESRVFAKIP